MRIQPRLWINENAEDHHNGQPICPYHSGVSGWMSDAYYHCCVDQITTMVMESTMVPHQTVKMRCLANTTRLCPKYRSYLVQHQTADTIRKVICGNPDSSIVPCQLNMMATAVRHLQMKVRWINGSHGLQVKTKVLRYMLLQMHACSINFRKLVVLPVG